jgi:Reverse transcriptase (RNA-dependent DNA polymerase)
MASLLIARAKASGGVRPIAISESFYKLATMYAVSLVKTALPAIFEPIQFGVGAPGGHERAVHLVQAGLETMGDDAILVKCDIRNAFNSRHRSQVLEELFRIDALKPIWSIAFFAYKQSSALLIMEHGMHRGTVRSEEGVKQGDTLGSLLLPFRCRASIAVAPRIFPMFAALRSLTT